MIIFKLLLFILSVVWNNTFVKAQNDDLKDFREVRNYLFSPNNYYDVIKYEFDITPTRNVGKFDYYIFSDKGVYSLIMNETEYELWKNEYYDHWRKDPTHDLHKYIGFLNTDNNKFMCKSLTAACQSSVQFPDKELYVVNVKNPTFEKSTYVFKDNFIKYKDDPTAAKLIYDPVNPPTTTSKQSTSSKSTKSSKVSSKTTKSSSTKTSKKKPTPSSTNDEINQNKGNSTEINENEINKNNSTNINNKPNINNNISDNNKNIVDENNNNWWWWLIGGIILLCVLLAMLLYGLMHHDKKDEIREAGDIQNEDSLGHNNYNGSEIEAKVLPYNPHHAVKRVAYNYKADDINFERDNIVEITKRYNDGWASAINPKDGKECIVPLIILEGDLSEDLSNIPYEEKSSKNILATPESLFENEYISRKDYEEMKRNDEWIKKVKLMKQVKPESTHNMIVGDNDQFKYISHPMQETKLENGIDPDTSKIINNPQSMVATLVNSNTELLNADHILEVCEEEDYEYEPEEGEIVKEEDN